MPSFRNFCKNLKSNINRQSLTELLMGVIGIYFSYILSGIINERIIKKPYVAKGGIDDGFRSISSSPISNQEERVSEYFNSSLGFVFSTTFIPWILSEMIIRFKIPKENRKVIPYRNAIACASVAAISQYCYNSSIYMLSFPVAALFKSCNALSVVLVGVCCSRVSDARQKLKRDKIIVGIIVTLGLLIFKLSDPEGRFFSKQASNSTDGSTFLDSLPINLNEFMGFACLFVSLIADGFLPDFQAEIKQRIKPNPYEMLAAINKWISLIVLAAILLTNQTPYLFKFCVRHPDLLLHLVLMGLLSTLGQVFVYRMINHFKQHIVPFVITTRKIVTASISLVIYSHETSFGEIMGIAIVFGIVSYEFAKAVAVGALPPGQSSTIDNTQKDKEALRDESEKVSLTKQEDEGGSFSENSLQQLK